jgi:hypothetical protein
MSMHAGKTPCSSSLLSGDTGGQSGVSLAHITTVSSARYASQRWNPISEEAMYVCTDLCNLCLEKPRT